MLSHVQIYHRVVAICVADRHQLALHTKLVEPVSLPRTLLMLGSTSATTTTASRHRRAFIETANLFKQTSLSGPQIRPRLSHRRTRCAAADRQRTWKQLSAEEQSQLLVTAVQEGSASQLRRVPKAWFCLIPCSADAAEIDSTDLRRAHNYCSQDAVIM